MSYIRPIVKPRTRQINSPVQQTKYGSESSELLVPVKREPSSDKNAEISRPYPVIEVGSSRFIIKSWDRNLIQELVTFSETLRESPRAEVRFTNNLIRCTEQGRLPPWGWQRQPHNPI